MLLIGSSRRNRVAYLVAIAVVILLGLASRRGAWLSGTFGQYPGDVLWAMVAFFGWGVLRPRTSTLGVALLALAFSVAIEFLKLWKAPWLVDLRNTTLGALVFGHVFSLWNVVAYAVGIAAAAVVELSWPYGRRDSQR